MYVICFLLMHILLHVYIPLICSYRVFDAIK